VGNFLPVKNHAFILRVLSDVVERRGDTQLLLVGQGPLQDSVRKAAEAAGLGERVVFAGQRSDVPRLLRGAVDVFVFPSHYEGLPVAVIEAQAAGLPVVLSDAVTTEVDIVPQLVSRLSLRLLPTDWAAACLAASSRRCHPAAILAQMEQSRFNIENGVRDLERIYEEGQRAA
jgi:glycosyltransferase involved in cell wall biosynthesis